MLGPLFYLPNCSMLRGFSRTGYAFGVLSLSVQIFHLSLEMLAGEQGPGCHP